MAMMTEADGKHILRNTLMRKAKGEGMSFLYSIQHGVRHLDRCIQHIHVPSENIGENSQVMFTH